MKKPGFGEFQGRLGPLFKDEEFANTYPLLYEHLTALVYEDGSRRATSTLLIFVDNGVLKCCINDRDNQRSAFVDSATFTGIVETLEAKLIDNELEWKTKQGYNSGGNKPTY